MDELDGARRGSRHAERDAWGEFVRASYPTTWRLCAALAGPAAADDLAQETYLRATQALPTFRHQASATTWLLAIARRVCMDELRRRYRRGRRDQRLAADASAPTTGTDHSGDVAARELLDHLDADRRTAFVLTQLFQLSYEEAAEVCDCPVGTIRSRVARARDDLIALIDSPRASQPRQATE